MAREVSDTQSIQDKFVKLIPTEIVGAYMVLAGLLGFSPVNTAEAQTAGAAASTMAAVTVANPQLNETLILIVFFSLLVLTPLYLWWVSKVTNVIQIIVTTVSYVVWVYTLGGPFVVWKIHYPAAASVVLVIWSVASTIITPAKPEPGNG
ncbi:MAG: hypothetical protein ABL962_10925 [Fimbriimonadaceae bacterium]